MYMFKRRSKAFLFKVAYECNSVSYFTQFFTLVVICVYILLYFILDSSTCCSYLFILVDSFIFINLY